MVGVALMTSLVAKVRGQSENKVVEVEELPRPQAIRVVVDSKDIILPKVMPRSTTLAALETATMSPTTTTTTATTPTPKVTEKAADSETLVYNDILKRGPKVPKIQVKIIRSYS